MPALTENRCTSVVACFIMSALLCLHGAAADRMPGDQESDALRARIRELEKELAAVRSGNGATASTLPAESLPPATMSLMEAVRSGNIGQVRAHIKWKTDVNATGSDGMTPLHCAVVSNQEPIVAMLLDVGASADAKGPGGATALHLAAEAGGVKIASLLLARGAAPTRGDDLARTALHLAASKRRTEVVALLLGKGADAKAQDDGGWTALHVAVLAGDLASVKLLLEHGAEAAVKNRQGKTALANASRGDKDLVSDVLIAAGAPRQDQLAKGETALCNAIGEKNIEMVSLLLKKGADPNESPDLRLRCPPLHVAVRVGDRESAALLLKHGADIEARHLLGTPLLIAATNGDVPMARFLLGKGAQIEARNSDGETLLHEAVSTMRTRAVQVLLGLGADVNAKVAGRRLESGQTPLGIAYLRMGGLDDERSKRQVMEIVRLLEARGGRDR